jgi:peptide/nickel transport system permease protein
MISHILKRLVVSILLLLVMSFVTFWLMHATPGNFFDSLKLNPQISSQTIADYERLYHLKDPLIVQYGHWLWNICRGEFGYSFYYNVPAAHVIGSRLGNTFILSLSTLVFTWMLAIPLGIWAALRHGRMADSVLSFFSFAALSAPSFFLAMLLLYAMSHLGLLPLGEPSGALAIRWHA